MKRNLSIISGITISLLILSTAVFAGIGDGNGPFDRSSEKNSTQGYGSSSPSTSAFGHSDDIIQDLGDPPLDPQEPIDVPLDGGASILLISGTAWGLSKIKKRKNTLSAD